MTPAGGAESGLPTPTCEALCSRFMGHAEALAAAGNADGARALRAAVEVWRLAQEDWCARIARTLSLHHEINNALVGVRGNAQLLLMGPAGKQPEIRKRLEVVIRESARIQEAAARIRELKVALGGPDSASRAA